MATRRYLLSSTVLWLCKSWLHLRFDLAKYQHAKISIPDHFDSTVWTITQPTSYYFRLSLLFAFFECPSVLLEAGGERFIALRSGYFFFRFDLSSR